MLELRYFILLFFIKFLVGEEKDIYRSIGESKLNPIQNWEIIDDDNKLYHNCDQVTWMFNGNSRNSGPQYIVCAGSPDTEVDHSRENNWLITEFYHSQANIVHIQIVYDIFDGHPYPQNCSGLFNIHVLQSDDLINVANNLDQFLQIYNLSLQEFNSTVMDNFTVLANFTLSKRGFYIGFQNSGYCVRLLSFRFYYLVCPAMSINQFLSVPDIPVPILSDEPTIIDFNCSVGSVSHQQAECYTNGSWRIPESVECVCERGWSQVNNLSCVACPVNTYKPDVGDEGECMSCGEMSNTNGMVGSESCECDAGWYRSEEESVYMLCGRSPSIVRNLGLERVDNGGGRVSIVVSWNEPIDVWNRSVSYQLSLYLEREGSLELWWRSDVIENMTYELSESELETSSREYLLLVTSLNNLVVLSDVEKSVNVRFVSTFPEVLEESLSLNEASSVMEWEYRLEGGVSNLSFEFNYTSKGGVLRQVRVNGCSIVTTDIYRCSTGVVDLDKNMSVVITLIPLFPNITNGSLSQSYNLSNLMVQSTATYNTTTLSNFDTQHTTIVPTLKELLNQTTSIYLILAGALCVLIFIVTCSIISFVMCCLIIKKRFLKIYHSLTYKDSRKYVIVDDTTHRTRPVSYQDPDMFENLREAVRHFAKEVNNVDIKIDEVIGNGEFGDVCMGSLNQDGHSIVVALKTLKPDTSERHKSDFYKEASIMGQFHHDNVITLLGVTLQHPVMIVTPFMPNSSLLHFLRKNTWNLRLIQQGRLALGVASGMSYLSSICFVHRDLAARNVLLDSDLTPKISDFGLSRETEEDFYTMSKGGKVAVRWTALEAILYKRFNSASDVWSYGVLLWEIMSFAQEPYEGMEIFTLVHKLQVGYRLPAPLNCPDKVYQLMQSCWLEDQDQRPSFTQIQSKITDKYWSNLEARKSRRLTGSFQADVFSFSSIREWLKSLEMYRYEDNFTDNGYTCLDSVWRLKEHDLLSIGIVPCVHRNKIMTSIRKANQVLGQQLSITDTTDV
ncbi:Ephrin type-B receptor 1 [Oopsacas minuta]|uniref:Ephrin type-B receptor 1 n=1 Tax=Oopsacas minuta TaxID=111878 RepID=A0AAV7JI22_9METZ|nr:Ephrin type-B receptor 1 [Oopsacas minuta]